jgi:hypothetical protein
MRLFELKMATKLEIRLFVCSLGHYFFLILLILLVSQQVGSHRVHTGHCKTTKQHIVCTIDIHKALNSKGMEAIYILRLLIPDGFAYVCTPNGAGLLCKQPTHPK